MSKDGPMDLLLRCCAEHEKKMENFFVLLSFCILFQFPFLSDCVSSPTLLLLVNFCSWSFVCSHSSSNRIIKKEGVRKTMGRDVEEMERQNCRRDEEASFRRHRCGRDGEVGVEE